MEMFFWYTKRPTGFLLRIILLRLIKKNCILFSRSPITYSWEGGKLISENDDFEDMVVTREDYEENGHEVCEEKFDI